MLHVLNQGSKGTIVGSQTMKNLKSQPIVRNRSAKIVKGSSKILKFVTISLHIRKISKGNIIEFGLKMKNTRSFIVLKIILNVSPSIKSTIIGTDNRCNKRRTDSTMNPRAENIIKTLPFGVLRNRCFSRVIEKNMGIHKMSLTMKLKESYPSIEIRAFIIKLNGNTSFNVSNQYSRV